MACLVEYEGSEEEEEMPVANAARQDKTSFNDTDMHGSGNDDERHIQENQEPDDTSKQRHSGYADRQEHDTGANREDRRYDRRDKTSTRSEDQEQQQQQPERQHGSTCTDTRNGGNSAKHSDRNGGNRDRDGQREGRNYSNMNHDRERYDDRIQDRFPRDRGPPPRGSREAPVRSNDNSQRNDRDRPHNRGPDMRDQRKDYYDDKRLPPPPHNRPDMERSREPPYDRQRAQDRGGYNRQGNVRGQGRTSESSDYKGRSDNRQDRGRSRSRSRDRHDDRRSGRANKRSRNEQSRSRSRSLSRSRSKERREKDGYRRHGFSSSSKASTDKDTSMEPSNPPPSQPVAPVQPIDPAEMVRRMMAAPGMGGMVSTPGVVTTSGMSTAGLTVAQKRALLWGSKKAEATAVKATAVAAPPPAEVAESQQIPAQPQAAQAFFGTNRWDAAEFSSDAEKAKFLRIMGVKGSGGAPPIPVPEPTGGHTAMRRNEQQRVLSDIEMAYTRGLAQTGKTQGLGAD